MKYFIELIAGIMLGGSWLAGIVLAVGSWGTVAAICIPFYAWYLVVEHILKLMHWVG